MFYDVYNAGATQGFVGATHLEVPNDPLVIPLWTQFLVQIREIKWRRRRGYLKNSTHDLLRLVTKLLEGDLCHM